MMDVAKALRMNPAYPTKFFGIELGAQSKYDKKREVAVVNGSHDVSAIEETMQKFIDIYVLCPSPACRLPEIRLKVKKEQIRADCAACGNQATVGDTHKLTVYIVKNPPTKSKKSKDGTDDKDKKKDKKKKKNKEDADDNVETSLEPAAAVEAAPAAEVWYTDTSDAAAEARKAEIMASMNGGSPADESLANSTVELESMHIAPKTVASNATPEEVLRFFVNQQERSPSEIVSELRRLEISRGLTVHTKLNILVSAIFDTTQARQVPAQVKQHAPLLRCFSKSRNEAQMLLGAFEHLICVVEPVLLVPRTSLILQALYENDVVSEDVLIDWYDSPLNSTGSISEMELQEMREKAEPFIAWLNEADESEEEEDED
jgi:translation initiation factor 5